MIEPIEDDDTDGEQTENNDNEPDTGDAENTPKPVPSGGAETDTPDEPVIADEYLEDFGSGEGSGEIEVDSEIEGGSDEIEADSGTEGDSDEIEADSGTSTAAKVGSGIGGILFLLWIFAGVDTGSDSDELGVL